MLRTKNSRTHFRNSTWKKAILLLTYTLSGSAVYSQDVKIPMRRAFESFKSLQPFLVDSQRFEDKKNEAQLSELITSLRDDFHDLSAFPSRFQSQPGFASNVAVVSETLDDAVTRFREGRKGYAAWRLRGISQNCISCHATYNVELTFHDSKDADLKDLNNLQRGEFFLATRQLEKAEKHFQLALREDQGAVQPIDVLRRLLTLYVRIRGDSALASSRIEDAIKGIPLPQSDREEVELWLKSLKRSGQDKGGIKSISDAESLIKRSIRTDDLLESHIDAVGLLQATSSLHTLLSQPGFSVSERPKGLYLLGLSYSKLPLFFIDEAPEFYLRQCIEESPNSQIAQRAYRLYEETVELGFTGIGGAEIPTDVRIKLMELHDKAYGIPHVNGRV